MSDFATKKRVLIHACCAPCLTWPLEFLEKAGDYSPAVFYFNPNIWPREEYDLRLTEAQKFCENRVEFFEEKPDHETWLTAIRGLENEPERGERCRICYRLRLERAAEFASQNGFTIFTSTLSISPHKRSNWLDEIGHTAAEKFEIAWLGVDWKKHDGYQKSVELSRKFVLRRQNYCGCEFSIRQSTRQENVDSKNL